MKTAPELNRLLEDVLGEDDPAGAMREAVWQRTLCHVRQRRRGRQAGRGALVLVGAAVVALAVWLRPASPAGAPEIARRVAPVDGVTVVTSLPLEPELIVSTRPGAVPVVGTVTGAMPVIATIPNVRSWEAIDDRQLLASLGGRPAAIVRHPNGEAELIFSNPADARTLLFPQN